MSHFAKVLNGKVIDIIVAEQEFFETFVDTTPGEWIQTSYNTHGGQHTQGGTPIRANFAGLGYTYDREHDVFYAPQPYPSWTIQSPMWIWMPPTPYPEDGKNYIWNESNQSWGEA
jgi:hypothetical protein